MQILVKLILNKVCLDDDNFGNDDTEILVMMILKQLFILDILAWCNRCKQCQKHVRRWTIKPFFIDEK